MKENKKIELNHTLFKCVNQGPIRENIGEKRGIYLHDFIISDNLNGHLKLSASAVPSTNDV